MGEGTRQRLRTKEKIRTTGGEQEKVKKKIEQLRLEKGAKLEGGLKTPLASK